MCPMMMAPKERLVKEKSRPSKASKKAKPKPKRKPKR